VETEKLLELNEACPQNGTCICGEAGNVSATACSRTIDGMPGMQCMSVGAELRLTDGEVCPSGSICVCASGGTGAILTSTAVSTSVPSGAASTPSTSTATSTNTSTTTSSSSAFVVVACTTPDGCPMAAICVNGDDDRLPAI